MRAKTLTIMLAILGIFLVGEKARADVLTISPENTAIMAAEGDDWTRVALEFDVSGMELGEGKGVLWAYLEWPIIDNSPGEKEFFAFPIVASWSPEQATSASGSVVRDADPVADWLLSSELKQEIGSVLRLDLRYLVSDWGSGVRGNYGIVVAVANIPSGVLESQLGNARLVVGFGSLGD